MSSSSEEENWMPPGFDIKSFKEQIKQKKSKHKIDLGSSEQFAEGLSYKELVDRLYRIIKKNVVERTALKVGIDIKRESNSKMTVNLREIAASINRDVNHMKDFLTANLCAEGNFTSSGRLVLRGNLQKSHIQNSIKYYFEAYVTCPTCKVNTETHIERKNKSDYLICDACKGEKYLPTSLLNTQLKKPNL